MHVSSSCWVPASSSWRPAGGVSSNYDPLDVSQFTEAEFRAAVDAAENWGTYVTVHAYTPRAIQTAIRGGVRCIDHGQLMDEATARIMAEKGIWFSGQPFLDDEDVTPFPAGSANRAKQLQMTQGTDNAYKLAKQYKLKTAWGTDTLFDAKLATRQGAQLAMMKRCTSRSKPARSISSGMSCAAVRWASSASARSARCSPMPPSSWA